MTPAASKPSGRSAEHVRRNRAAWDADSDDYQRMHASQLNRFDGGRWGTFAQPESRLGVLGDVRDKQVLELGCGAGQWSIVLARQGARTVGMDLSGRQLEHAHRLVERAKTPLPLVQASAEQLPFTDEAFDLVFCDHGAMSFADPFRTVPEVARVLRRSGLFAFNIATPFHFLCWNETADVVDDRLRGSYFDLRRFDPEDGLVDFQLPYGEWIRLFRANGLAVEDLIEPRPPANAKTTYSDFVSRSWARSWPAENIWKVRKTAASDR
jgi:SAM-dependent methyltransferase